MTTRKSQHESSEGDARQADPRMGLMEGKIAELESEIAEAWRVAMRGKRAGHGIDDPSFLQPARPMSAIGG